MFGRSILSFFLCPLNHFCCKVLNPPLKKELEVLVDNVLACVCQSYSCRKNIDIGLIKRNLESLIGHVYLWPLYCTGRTKPKPPLFLWVTSVQVVLAIFCPQGMKTLEHAKLRRPISHFPSINFPGFNTFLFNVLFFLGIHCSRGRH